MLRTLQIFDEDVKELLEKIDAVARKADSAKYGLPPDNNTLLMAVYHWVDLKGNDEASTRFMKECQDAFCKISLASQNSASSKEECGKIAREALQKIFTKPY